MTVHVLSSVYSGRKRIGTNLQIVVTSLDTSSPHPALIDHCPNNKQTMKSNEKTKLTITHAVLNDPLLLGVNLFICTVNYTIYVKFKPHFLTW